jgi:plastocyanin
MSRSTAPVLLALLASLVAAGCGRGDSVTRVDRPALDYSLVDFRIHPQEVVVPAGTIQIRVRNDGRLPHNLHIAGRTGARLELSAMLPGESATARVKLPKGRWTVFCSIANHKELGMHGTLVTR